MQNVHNTNQDSGRVTTYVGKPSATGQPTRLTQPFIRHRVTYKLCVLMHQVHRGSSPSYLSDLVTATANIQLRKRL